MEKKEREKFLNKPAFFNAEYQNFLDELKYEIFHREENKRAIEKMGRRKLDGGWDRASSYKADSSFVASSRFRNTDAKKRRRS